MVRFWPGLVRKWSVLNHTGLAVGQLGTGLSLWERELVNSEPSFGEKWQIHDHRRPPSGQIGTGMSLHVGRVANPRPE